MVLAQNASSAEPDTFGGQKNLATLDSIAIPDEGSLVDGFGIEQFTYDDNLYRLPNSITNVASLISPSASREDHINTVSAGVDGQWIYSGQALGGQAQVDDNRYSRNSDLNNISGHGKAVWDWRAGTRWLGEVGADYTRSLAGSANSKFFARDLVDQSEYFGTALFEIGAHWNLIGGFRYSNSTHTALAREFEDFHSTTENFGVEYVSLSENTFAWEYRHTDGRFPQTLLLNGIPFDQNYQESSERFLVKYSVTPKLLLDASAGYLRRTYPNGDRGSFDGNVWRAVLTWQPSPKTQVVFAGWRELIAYIDTQSDYFVSRGESISPIWTLSEKISLSMVASYASQNYINSNPVIIDLGQRRDRLSSQQAAVQYSPRKELMLKLSYGIEHRASNQAEFQYDDRLATANLTLKF